MRQQTSIIIVLNIGGTKFSTSLSTLQSVEGSFFDKLIEEQQIREQTTSEEGAYKYFIDRDPFVFRYILNFLREGDIDLEQLTPQERKAISKDASFYQLPRLSSLIDAFSNSSFQDKNHNNNNNSTSNSNISNNNNTNNNNNNNNNTKNNCNQRIHFVNPQRVHVCEDNRTVIGIEGGSLRNRCVSLSTVIPLTSTDTYHFKFKINKLKNWIGIGMYDSAQPDRHFNVLGHGFYLQSSNGYTFHSDDLSVNAKQGGIKFMKGNIIEMEYNADTKILMFKGKSQSILCDCMIKINCPRDLIPVVILSSGDVVSLVEN